MSEHGRRVAETPLEKLLLAQLLIATRALIHVTLCDPDECEVECAIGVAQTAVDEIAELDSEYER
jgi:hypothetical protein